MPKAIFIDAENQRVELVEGPLTLADLQKYVGGYIEIACKWDNGDVLLVNENGMRDDPGFAFRIPERPDQPLMGNGVIVGREIEAENNVGYTHADVGADRAIMTAGSIVWLRQLTDPDEIAMAKAEMEKAEAEEAKAEEAKAEEAKAEEAKAEEAKEYLNDTIGRFDKLSKGERKDAFLTMMMPALPAIGATAEALARSWIEDWADATFRLIKRTDGYEVIVVPRGFMKGFFLTAMITEIMKTKMDEFLTEPNRFLLLNLIKTMQEIAMETVAEHRKFTNKVAETIERTGSLGSALEELMKRKMQ